MEVGGTLEEVGQGPEVIAGGSTQSPWLRLRNTQIIEGEGTVLSEGDVVASRQVFKRRWKRPLWEREEDRNEDGTDVKFGDDSRRNGSETWENRQSCWSNQKWRTDRLHYSVCASTADVQDNYGKTSDKIRGGGVCWANVYGTCGNSRRENWRDSFESQRDLI